VTDLTGKLIQKGVLEEITTKLDLSAYQNGMYFFNAGGITLKMIKE
jgi:hypothetical protein